MALRPIYYDTETTGIDTKKDKIIELAAYDPVQNRTFETLINPGCPIPKEATAVHHITDEMVKDSPSFGEIAEKFTEFCAGDTVLIAHNNDGFDRHFMKQEYLNAGFEEPQFLYLDTLKWARKYRPDLPRHSLQFLREIYGFEENNAHRALDDVKMLHQIFAAMIDDLSFEQIVELMGTGGAILKMPFGKHQGKKLEEVPKDYLNWLLESGALDKPQNEELKIALLDRGLIKETATAT